MTAEDYLLPGGPVSRETWLGAPALSYPGRPATVLDVLDRAVRRWPAATAFVDLDSTEVSVADFAERVEGCAQWLRERGIGPGDAVAVLSANSVDLAVLLFGCARAGSVMVGLNARLAPAQWSWMLGHSQARLLLASPALAAQLAEPAVPAAVPLGDATRRAAPWSYRPGQGPDPAACYAVVYTSGTTGRPKASQVVHRASVHSAISYQRLLQLGPGERTAVLFPLYYISAMHAHVLPALLGGATCVLAETAAPREFVDLLARERIGWAYAVPAVWALAARLEHFDRAHLPALSRLGAGGAPLPAGLVALLRERLPGTRLFDVYGLSETHSPAAILADEQFAGHPGSVGPPLPCMQAEVRDENGAVLAPGRPGSLWLRGSLVTTGYAKDPVATAAAIVDGWFDTGDVARCCEHGFLYILDRTKDMIIKAGAKIFSAEVEAVLRRHPAVADAAVVAVPDSLAGEAVAAFVVARAAVAPRELRALVAAELAEHAAPREVHELTELPRNSVGKVDKARLRELAAERAPARHRPSTLGR